MSDRIINETELIQTYLAPLTRGVPGAFNLADDAALLSPPENTDLVISTDPIIAGVHFFPDDRPDDIAWKALAVNVSDLVAKGAEPWAFTMTLAFPNAPERAWMKRFADGIDAAQKTFGFQLVGGDTDRTPGPLAIGITAIGLVPRGAMIARSSAKLGNHVFVTGTLGDSALGLKLHRAPPPFAEALSEGDISFLIGRYLRPDPRRALIGALRSFATAAIDVSDGLLKDLTRLANGHGLAVGFSRLPLSPSTRLALGADAKLASTIVAGGDDYEVLFTVDPRHVGEIQRAAALAGVNITDLGVLTEAGGVRVVADDGREISAGQHGYDHFRF